MGTGGGVLHGFTIERVLSSDERTKSVTVLGRYENKRGTAVVTLRRRHFDESSLPRLLSRETHAASYFENDIYTKYTGKVPAELGEIDIDMIYPATDKHISKHEEQAYFMVSETAEMYRNIVKPYIDSWPASRIQWVYNILEKKKEIERLIFENPDPDKGFMLHIDLKWDQQQVDALYCIAIVHRRDIKSLRDLKPEHLPLLKNILKQGTEAIRNKYGLTGDQLRVFIHYQPSYYHLHVHFMHIRRDAGAGMAVGKAHLLSDIIERIKLKGDFYQQCTISTAIGERDPLFALLRSQLESAEVASGEGPKPQK